VTLAIALVLGAIGVALAGAHEFWQAMLVDRDADTSGPLAVVAWLTTINAFVLVFNLIPAFPLDGGRIVRSIAWWRSGDRMSATRFAAGLGRGFSYLFIGAGIFLVIQGAGISGLWLAVIGWILGQAARSATVQTAVQSSIEGIEVADIMDREPVAIPDTLTLDRAYDEFFLRYRWPWFPVVDPERRIRGVLHHDAIEAVAEEARQTRTIGEIVGGQAAPPTPVRDDATLESVLSNEGLRRLGAILAVDAEGRLSGVVTVEQVSRALQGALGGLASGR
jgi:CBS domain-containing protein